MPLKQPHFVFGDSCRLIGKTVFFDFATAQSIFSHCGVDLLTTFITGEMDSEQSGWIYPDCVQYSPARSEASMALQAVW